MERTRRFEVALWTLQGSLAASLLGAGLLRAGLPDDVFLELPIVGASFVGDAPPWAGWLLVAASLLLVLPSATGFSPRLTPVAATFLASGGLTSAALELESSGSLDPLGLCVAVGCAGVAVGRSLLAPVDALSLREDGTNASQLSLTPHPHGDISRAHAHP